MSKRKSKLISDATAFKSRRVTAVDTEPAPDDSNHQGPSSSSSTATGDIGLIESISLKNFMCHHSLGLFRFGPNVNFIVGNNGSGKSAILTALIVGLGGKATMTNRGASLKDFVKTSENAADITVKLRNRGPDAYKKDVYGDCISIEHRIWSDGSRTCKLKNKSGQIISSKKEELTAILDHFNIQLDNPVSILSQEMSKQFLHSKSESDKYKFFMKATLLEQMKRDYVHIKHTKTVTRQQVERQEEVTKTLNSEEETQHRKQQKTLCDLKQQLEELQNKCSQLNQEIGNKHQALFKGREERDKLRLEERNVQVSYESKLKRKNQLCASRSNKLKRFGDHVPDLMALINEASDKGRFRKRPVGPIGACINLKDPTLAVAVECCLRSFMKAFCCDNYKDEAVLQELMSRFYSKGNRPQIIVSPFSEKLHNIDGRKAYHPEYPSVPDVITATSPVIVNCLIDMRGIESILIIKEKDKARRVMQQGRPPKNCREAFTAEGDQVYPNRYYTSDFSMAKYLGGDLETEISMLESDLENHQAQLSRFQLHVSSVTEDIAAMESSLSGTIVTLKRTLASVNQVKATITELETACEEHIDDISSLEEVAQENQQKIEAEKQTVQEAKAELDEHRKKAEDADSQYSSVRDRIDQLSEEMEPLKDEQLTLEAECAKHERNLKFLENRLKAHEGNIQALKNDLTQREAELQEYVAKATEISPERQQVSGSTKSIDTEISRLKRKIRVYESSHGEQEQVVREYAEALALYREKTNQVRDLRRFIDQLDNIVSDRQNRYKIMRRSLSVRCKLYFNNFLIKMNCCGSMIFDHNNETLAISVKPPGREEDPVSDVRTLSGGERSFSTVCFMLSLWEITESPFRCLDEFDVYMDMHNRRICLDLLLELSERQHLRQFIFITPLTTSHLPKSSLVKIHQLQDPEREQRQNTT
ncbi:structural maintenance of chromosomes protein 6 [Stegastes partitus]|uniref:Structural maintenance of chromosomes protein 6 n=1 Tax=Stegastes partitus TaxID=144197 RepID=A0A9Y4N708_9TELE|nr:PREDICTED: structural maintenance of chromosomes protein 6-like [Stegastes partitus]